MVQPLSILNTRGQSLDVQVGADGVIRLKLGIGEKAASGLANVAAWQGMATHTDGATPAAADGVVLLAGYDGTVVRKALVDTTGRQLVDVQARRLVIVQTPTVTSGGIYAAKDVVGGLLTFASAARAAILSGVLETVVVVDKGQQMADLDLVLFNVTLTPAADNAIFAPTDAVLATSVGVVKVVAADYRDLSTNSIATVHPDLPYVLVGTSLFGVLVSRGTPTYTSTTDLVVTLTVRTD